MILRYVHVFAVIIIVHYRHFVKAFCYKSFIYTKTGAAADNEIDAISGATITTNAITNGVNCGLYYFNNYLGGADHE